MASILYQLSNNTPVSMYTHSLGNKDQIKREGVIDHTIPYNSLNTISNLITREGLQSIVHHGLQHPWTLNTKLINWS